MGLNIEIRTAGDAFIAIYEMAKYLGIRILEEGQRNGLSWYVLKLKDTKITVMEYDGYVYVGDEDD